MEEDFLHKLPKLEQRQDSIADQLADLQRVGNRLGMYDAADAIAQVFTPNRLSSIQYGCHVDLEPGEEPDECVIDSGRLHDCVYAKEGMRKEQCEYWKIITS